ITISDQKIDGQIHKQGIKQPIKRYNLKNKQTLKNNYKLHYKLSQLESNFIFLFFRCYLLCKINN
ncbi:hypothetical protein, partial [Enterococcus mundtii]|uniref:hypothetical protein n=1 Tax=Enterococcus mundtii TaxID=53346 RepID=UPI000D3F1CFE